MNINNKQFNQHSLFRWLASNVTLGCQVAEVTHGCRVAKVTFLGKPSRGKSEVFLNIVQKAFDPPPPFI